MHFSALGCGLPILSKCFQLSLLYLNLLNFYHPVAITPPAAHYVSMCRGTKSFRVFPQFESFAT